MHALLGDVKTSLEAIALGNRHPEFSTVPCPSHDEDVIETSSTMDARRSPIR